MGVTSTINRIREVGNGSKTAFDFPFPIFAASELEVYKVVRSTDVVTLKVLTTDYTVSINTVTEGGTVTFLVAPTTLEDSLIVRVLPFTQGAVLPTEGNFREDQVEQQLDRGVMRDIQLQEQIDRCVQVGIAESTLTADDLNEAVADAEAAAASATAAQTAAASSQTAAAASAAAAAASAASVPSMATILANVLATFFPIGSLYSNGAVTTNPGTLFGFGTWVAHSAGKHIVGLDAGGDADFDALADTGGSKTKNIQHTHDTLIPETGWSDSGTGTGGKRGTGGGDARLADKSITSGNGGSTTQDVMNPYTVAAIWRRTA